MVSVGNPLVSDLRRQSINQHNNIFNSSFHSSYIINYYIYSQLKPNLLTGLDINEIISIRPAGLSYGQ